MANKRTYWAIEAIGTAPHGVGEAPGTYQFVPGVQSVGMSTNFNLDQIFQLGQLEIYQDLEDIPDIELTIEKVIDDTILMYVRAMDPLDANGVGTKTKTLTDCQNNRVDVMFTVNSDAHDVVGDGAGDLAAYMSGLFLSSASFSFNTDGYFTENVSLVGNHQKWFNPAATLAGAPTDAALDAGDVARRHNFSFDDIGNVPAPLSTVGAALADLRIVSVNVSTDLGREEMFSLGERQAYHRYVTFPVEVTCDIEAYVTDAIDFGFNALPEAVNVQSNQTIKFQVDDGFVTDVLNGAANAGAGKLHEFDLGAKNTLQSVTWNGVSTDGTNATVTYSYRNFNKLDVISQSSTFN